jgi:hypothetical protein
MTSRAFDIPAASGAGCPLCLAKNNSMAGRRKIVPQFRWSCLSCSRRHRVSLAECELVNRAALITERSRGGIVEYGSWPTATQWLRRRCRDLL